MQKKRAGHAFIKLLNNMLEKIVYTQLQKHGKFFRKYSSFTSLEGRFFKLSLSISHSAIKYS